MTEKENKRKINVPVMANLFAEGKKPEYLFWVGCAGSYDDRYKKVTRDFVKILEYLGISYAVLGNEESCTGDPAKRAGNEFLFQMQALGNIEVLNGYEVKKIITACPHCFNIFKNEYPELGGNYEIIHHTQFLNKLINEGKLQIDDKEFINKKITFHDPCYLGRGNNEYEAPRKVLSSLKSELVEMNRSHSKALCCGAGGAQMFKEAEEGKKEIYNERAEEAIATKSDIIATACPFCMTMLTDGIKMAEEDNVEVLDLAELVVRVLKL
ncbi:MAG: (Fe-S)-binding protein [Chlorobi bacterium]|nr:(Fe-S)-binding protein [Chlorobiota bacterium]